MERPAFGSEGFRQLANPEHPGYNGPLALACVGLLMLAIGLTGLLKLPLPPLLPPRHTPSPVSTPTPTPDADCFGGDNPWRDSAPDDGSVASLPILDIISEGELTSRALARRMTGSDGFPPVGLQPAAVAPGDQVIFDIRHRVDSFGLWWLRPSDATTTLAALIGDGQPNRGWAPTSYGDCRSTPNTDVTDLVTNGRLFLVLSELAEPTRFRPAYVWLVEPAT